MESKKTQPSQIQQPKTAPVAPPSIPSQSGLSPLRIQDIMLATTQAAAAEARNVATLALIEQKAKLDELKEKLGEQINLLKNIESKL